MRIQEPVLQKLLFEWRFRPQLGFYERMDKLGVELAGEFPDWQRSGLTLELRNRLQHRRIFLSNGRCFQESERSPDYGKEIESGRERLDKVHRHFELKPPLQRVGIRHWFLGQTDESFPTLAGAIYKRFCAKEGVLEGQVNSRVRDFQYVVDFEHGDGWKYNVRMGPMEKKQWFEVVPYEVGIFQDEGETFEKFKASMPEHFVYIDVDCFREECKITDVPALVRGVRDVGLRVAKWLIKECRG